jgi:hypothetical protein
MPRKPRESKYEAVVAELLSTQKELITDNVRLRARLRVYEPEGPPRPDPRDAKVRALLSAQTDANDQPLNQ